MGRFGEQPCFLDAIDRQIKICDLVLVVGTSNTVYPAAGYAREAQRRGAKVAVFNIEEVSHFLSLNTCSNTDGSSWSCCRLKAITEQTFSSLGRAKRLCLKR